MSCRRGHEQSPRCATDAATPQLRDVGDKADEIDSEPSRLTARYSVWLSLNVHFHMLFLDGVYVERPDGSLRFRWVKAPTSAELARLTQVFAHRIGRYLERQGLLERDAENSYLAGEDLEAGPMEQILGSSITYRIAVGPQRGRKVFTLQRRCRRVTRPSMTGSGRSPDSLCTPVSRRGRINARSSSGCVGISAGRRSRRSVCR